MKKLTLALILSFLLLFTLFSCYRVTYHVSDKRVPKVVKPGIEVLRDNGFKELKGKRVGLVTNPTGIDNNLVSTVDILFNAPEVELVALYGPEHGVRGDIHAGDKFETTNDPKTGLPVFSLYGKTRKPTAEMLEGVDVIIYDIQDNGCRSYTFISTLGLLMEAAAEYGKEVMVLDRPNPLGGRKIEGCLVEPGFESFVSQYPIPYLYALTCGEFAKLLNGENMLKKTSESGEEILKCKLTVIPMEGWNRDMLFSDTGMPWVLPSPHIPHDISSYYYPASGILGELSYMSIGVGYTLPFQLFAEEWIDAAEFTDRLNALDLQGVRFRPIFLKPFYATGQGKTLQGAQIYITDPKIAPLTDVQFYAMEILADMYPDRAVFKEDQHRRYRMFDQVCGSDYIRMNFAKRHKFSDIKDYWYKDVEAFRKLSAKYHLY